MNENNKTKRKYDATILKSSQIETIVKLRDALKSKLEVERKKAEAEKKSISPLEYSFHTGQMVILDWILALTGVESEKRF